MASGSLYSLALSHQIDASGRPLGGARLFTYLAGSTTPYTTFQTSALAAENPWPLVADSTGRLPPMWLDAANTYKARLTTAAGVLVWEYDAIPAIGPGAGGGGVDTTPADAIFSTGMWTWMPVNTTMSGWVRANGRTIGSATSGATERANADTQALFEYLWATFSNTICAVGGGRGASASADWGANKQITLIDMRGRSLLGLDSMGNSASGRLTGITFAVGDKDTAASTCGAALHTLTDAQVPATAVTVNISDPGHAHNVAMTSSTVGSTGVSSAYREIGGAVATSSNATGITASGTVQGSGGSHNNVQPSLVGTYFIKL